MNKFKYLQALTLSALETHINAFAENNLILSVSLLEHNKQYVAAIVYSETHTLFDVETTIEKVIIKQVKL